MTMQEFLQSVPSLKLETVKTFHNPDMEDSGEDAQSVRIASGQTVVVHKTHWQCKLMKGGEFMIFHFTKGSAHHEKDTGRPIKPALDEVLDCLASDSASVENAKDFEDWAAEFGYDTDSRKAEKTYQTCQRQAEALKRVLGPDAYNVLLFEVDRL